MTKPVAVIISDIHFTPSTLDLASKALKQAQQEALDLNVPLVIAGDTLDSKSIIRAEVANALIEILDNIDNPDTYMLVGNHDLCNEKGEENALNFLAPYVNVVAAPVSVYFQGYGPIMLIPYQSSGEAMLSVLNDPKTPYTIICHQGVLGADMGHYVQDKTSLPPEAYCNHRVISGHYHKAQDITTNHAVLGGCIGLFSYVGNPYTLTFGEANHSKKGYAVLMSDGTLERLETNLREHKILDLRTVDVLKKGLDFGNDLLWVKLRGSQSDLDAYDKKLLDAQLGTSNYKFEKIPDGVEFTLAPVKQEELADEEIFDNIIDTLSESDTHKSYLKQLWREVV